MSTSPNPSRIARSPSPSLPPPPTSAKLPPRPSASTTQHVPYSRQSLGPGLSSAALPGGLVNPPGSARNFSGPARAVGGGRPVSEILGGGLGVPGGGGNADMRSPEAEAIDRWFQDLASYEVTLEEMAAASLDQNFTEELSAIEQWFRVLSEAERTAALYSLLQHSTQVQIRFFMTVLQQMARTDPMTALLSPAIGGGMQAQMEAKLANLNLRSPNRTSFGGVPPSATRDSFGGGNDHPSSYLTPESALANAGEGPVAPSPRSASSSSANKASHRISAPGTLNSLSPSWAGAGQLDQVLERGPSPSAESVSSARSNLNNDVRPKSTDFTGLANGPPGSASFARSSPRLGNNGNGNGAGGEDAFPLSPNGVGGNWASMVNTPAVPMFATNHSTIQDHPAFSSLASSVPKLSEAPKRRSSAKMSMGGGGNNLYNEDGELVGQKSSQQQQQQHVGRGLQSPGALGGGFQGPGAGAWSRSPGLGNDHLGGGFPNNFGLGVGGLGGGGFAGLGSPSPSDIAFQMSQLQLQQLQLQQLQQFQQLGVANNGGIGMGLPMMTGLGMGMNGPGGLGFGQAPRSASLRSQSGYSANGAGGGKRSPMMGMGGNVNKSPSPGGRRESSGVGAGPEEDTDIRVLEDIPQWLRTLRLHKYTPNFEGAKWRDMVLMGDSDLEAKGVAALGARRKLLKTFELVRAQYGIAEPAGSTANGGENAGIASSASGDDEDFKR